MTNHVHILVSSDKTEAISVMMKALGQRYLQYINRSYRRSGTYGKDVIVRVPRKQKLIYSHVNGTSSLTQYALT